MEELTTKELLGEMSARGFTCSQKLLVDLVRRGLIGPSVRRPRREGGHGTESYWNAGTVERLAQIAALRREGIGYDDIMDRLGVERPRVRRLSMTAWIAASKVENLEAVSKATHTPMVVLFQQGARLYHEAPVPVREFFDLVQGFRGATGDATVPSTDATFTLWGDVAVHYYQMLEDLLAGRALTLGDAAADGYLFWRMVHDPHLPDGLLQSLHVAQEDVVRDGEVVATLTEFSGRLRLLRPLENIADDLERCRALAKELGALLVTGEGHDFNHSGAAQALARVGDWLRENKEV